MTENVTFDFDHTLKRLSGEERQAQVAFKELHDHFAPNIYYSSKKFLRSAPLAEDLVQEVFTAIWEKRKQLTHVNNLERYVYGMTKRMAYDLIRRGVNAEIRKRKYLEMVENLDDPDKEKYARQLDELVEKLPSPRKQIFQLAKIEGEDVKIIAQRFKISVNAVHHHVSRALNFIKKGKRDITAFLLVAIAFVRH